MSIPGDYVDVAIVGAGLSGIGAACRLRSECPELTFSVLEQRSDIGGTWDLFRYPGVRSDSDMYTLGYSFRPWRHGRALADGGTILEYIRRTAAECGVEDSIRRSTKVVKADFHSDRSQWRLTLEVTDAVGQVTAGTLWCRFLYSCAGYYDYERPYEPHLPGLERFSGQVVHPQFWPEDFDGGDKRVVVIGSGATAVTLVPALAKTAKSVVMLQRSPTWIGAVPGVDSFAETVKRLLPAGVAHRVVRTKNILFSTAFYQFCQRLPRLARRVLLERTGRELGDAALVRAHFTPTYDPWDQRFCAVPDGDLFQALRSGRAEVVTETIDGFESDGVRLASERVLPADVVVTATGLRLQAFGGIEPSVDGRKVDLSREFVWQGTMVSGLPNFAVCIGYTNASWTLRADLSHRLVCRVLNRMRADGFGAAVPAPAKGLSPRPLLDLAAGYIRRSVDAFPRQGDRGAWRVRQNYILDTLGVWRARLGRDLRLSGRWTGQDQGDPTARCGRSGAVPTTSGVVAPTSGVTPSSSSGVTPPSSSSAGAAREPGRDASAEPTRGLLRKAAGVAGLMRSR